MPRGIYVMCMRTTIYIYHSRVFLVCIEIRRANHSPIQIRYSVRSLYRTVDILRNLIAFPRILCREIAYGFLVCGKENVYVMRNLRL